MDPAAWPDETAIGKHTGDLNREDFPSLNLAVAEYWWEPRHKAGA